MTRADNHVGDARMLRWALDELSADEHAEVEAHLAACERCRSRADAERRVDELLLAASPAPPPGSSARAFDRLWSAVDADESAGPDVSAPTIAAGSPGSAVTESRAGWSWRRVASLAAAAALLAWVVSLLDDDARPADDVRERLVDAGPGEGQRAEPRADDPGAAEDPLTEPAPPSPLQDERPDSLARDANADVEPALVEIIAPVAPSLDPSRLAAARERVAEVLRLADEHAPFDEALFQADCEEGLAELWRDDWPVTALVRGHALGPDPGTALAALRWAAGEPAGAPILAAALDHPARRDDVLVLLEQDPAPMGNSSALRRGLEQLARQSADGQVLAILASSPDADARRSLDRVLARLAADVRDPEQLATLCAALDTVPVELSVRTLLELGAEIADAPEARQVLDALVGSLVERGRDAVLATLAEHAADGDHLDWLPVFGAHGLDELAPAVVARLHEQPDHPALLATLKTLGGPEAARGLLDVWRQQRYRRAEGPLLSGLRDVLAAQPELADELAAGWHDARVDDLVALADELPAALRGPLLAGALPRVEAAAGRSSSGHTERLLVALARHGRPAEGAAVVAWLEQRPGDDDLLALAWATAGSLDPVAAEEAWSRHGRDPSPLREAAERSGPRFAAERPPARRDLRPLRDSLRRAAAPPR